MGLMPLFVHFSNTVCQSPRSSLNYSASKALASFSRTKRRVCKRGTDKKELLNCYAGKNLDQGFIGFHRFTTITLKFPSFPTAEETCASRLLPGGLEFSPVNTRSVGVEALSSLSHSASALAGACLLAGVPASAQSAPGCGGFLLLPINSFLICGRTFVGKDCPLLFMSG